MGERDSIHRKERNFFVTTVSRPALENAHPPFQRVLGDYFLGGKGVRV
jgi:hypothetical protein